MRLLKFTYFLLNGCDKPASQWRGMAIRWRGAQNIYGVKAA